MIQMEEQANKTFDIIKLFLYLVLTNENKFVRRNEKQVRRIPSNRTVL